VLLLRSRETYNNNGETENAIYKELDDVPLLVIDDVGKKQHRDYNFVMGVYYRVIDARYTSQRPIILTTNLDFKELEEHVGGASADRIREMADGNIVKMTGQSYRKPK